MSDFWEEFKRGWREAQENNPRTQPKPDSFFWPGVVLIILAILAAIFGVILSLP